MKACWVVANLTLDNDRVVLQSGMSRAQLLCWDTRSAIDSFRADVAILTDYSNFIAVFELLVH